MPGIPAPLYTPPSNGGVITQPPPRDYRGRDGWSRRDSFRGYGGYGNYNRPRDRIVCDPYGRCWRDSYGSSYGFGYTTRPPGWADDLPGRLQDSDRFFRPRSNVVCDQRTSLCYKNGRIDKSETEDVFGNRAGDRADDLRDDRGTGRVFVPERGVTCDPAQRACYDGGFKDYSLTRRYFGREAADRLD